jgi:hypothetical protein
MFVDFGHFLKKYNNFEETNFGQKIVVLAYSEGNDVSKTSLCSIFQHFEPN